MHLWYRSWHAGLDCAFPSVTSTQWHAVTQSHSAHSPRPQGSYICLRWRSVSCFLALGSSSHWLTWMMAPPLAMPVLALHLAALSCSGFGWRYRHPKLVGAIDPAWPCHSWGLIIRLITLPLRFLPRLTASAFFPSGLPQNSPQKSKAILINEKWVKISQQIWSDIFFSPFWQLLWKAGNSLNGGWFCLDVEGEQSTQKVMRIHGSSLGSQCLLIKPENDRPFAALSSCWKRLFFFFFFLKRGNANCTIVVHRLGNGRVELFGVRVSAGYTAIKMIYESSLTSVGHN